MGSNKYATLKAWRKANPEAHKAILRKYRSTHREKIAEDLRKRKEGLLGPFSEADGPDWQARNKERFSRMRKATVNRKRRRDFQAAISHYGGECFCCGEKELDFLALDHIDGGGNAHRKKIGGHSAAWAKANGWPSIFRVACHNCNYAIYKNDGVCPHMRKSGAAL